MSCSTISIFGCGWLGFPFAESLLRQGHRVKGSTTSREKLALLRSSGVEAYLIDSQPQLSGEDVESFFKSQILVLTLPFRRQLKDPAFYKNQIQAILREVEKTKIEFVVFTSSTSIYPDKDFIAREEEEIVNDDPRARVLLEVEQLLLRSNSFDATVVRFAGLYGDERQPGRFLSGRSELERPNAPVNLIHREDCVGILHEIIRCDIRNEIFNACADVHPTRREFYTKAAERAGLSTPVFKEDGKTGKVVSNAKLKECLNYRFKHPDPSADMAGSSVFSLIVCVAGTIVIVAFAVGLETGHRAAGEVLAFFVRHIGWVISFSVLICLGMVLSLRKSKRP